jgi:hypothetical protein
MPIDPSEKIRKTKFISEIYNHERQIKQKPVGPSKMAASPLTDVLSSLSDAGRSFRSRPVTGAPRPPQLNLSIPVQWAMVVALLLGSLRISEAAPVSASSDHPGHLGRDDMNPLETRSADVQTTSVSGGPSVASADLRPTVSAATDTRADASFGEENRQRVRKASHQSATAIVKHKLSRGETSTLEKLIHPPKGDGTLEINLLVTDDVAKKAGMNSGDPHFRNTYRHALNDKVMDSFRKQLQRIFPEHPVKIKYHFGYKGYYPRGGHTKSDYDEHDPVTQETATWKDLARYVHKHGYAVKHGHTFVVIGPDAPRYTGTTEHTEAGFAAPGGSVAFVGSGDNLALTIRHEVGHNLGGEHGLANKGGLFGWGRTPMFEDTSGIFRSSEFSVGNVQRMRKNFDTYEGSGRKIPQLQMPPSYYEAPQEKP